VNASGLWLNTLRISYELWLNMNEGDGIYCTNTEGAI